MRGVQVFKALAAALVLGAVASAANAAVVFSDNFDGYANQAAFEAAWPAVTPANVPASGTLSTVQAVSAPNSVNIPISSTTATTPRNQRSFTESGVPTTSQNVVWSFDFFDSAPAASPFRQSSNLQDGTAGSGSNQLVSMGLNNNQSATNSGGNYYMARIVGYDVTAAAADPDGGPAETVGGVAPYFKLNDFATSPLRSAGWHNLKVVISTDDGLSTDYAFFVDNILAERVSNIGTAATIRSYETIRIGSGVSSTAEAFYDNYLVTTEAVPEPASVALLGLGAFAWVAKRRRAA